MATRLKWVAVLILIYVATTNFRCHKLCLGTEQAYTFKIGVQAYPDKDSIHIGDTIWFEINESDTLVNIGTGNHIKYSGAENLGTAIGFGKYKGANSMMAVANSFDDILISGMHVSNPYTSKIREFLFEQQNGKYIFKLGIVPKDTGIFGVGFSNAANVFRKNDKCTKAYFIINFKNTDQHYYLNPNINSSTDLPQGSYFFKVY